MISTLLFKNRTRKLFFSWTALSAKDDACQAHLFGLITLPWHRFKDFRVLFFHLQHKVFSPLPCKSSLQKFTELEFSLQCYHCQVRTWFYFSDMCLFLF